jgi:hypothetical protein
MTKVYTGRDSFIRVVIIKNLMNTLLRHIAHINILNLEESNVDRIFGTISFRW